MVYTYFVSDCILQLGRTKVFLRAGQIAVLDSRRGEILDNASRIVQGHFRTFTVRKKFLSTKKASISIQTFCRGMLDLSVVPAVSYYVYFVTFFRHVRRNLIAQYFKKILLRRIQ